MDIRVCNFLDHGGKLRCTECGVTVDLCLCTDVSEKAESRLKDEHQQFLREVASLYESDEFAEDHLFAELVQEIGNVGSKLVSHTRNRTPAPAEIHRNLLRVAVLVTRIAVEGTGEYSYPAT
jgi:hypothetical protein